MPLDYSKFDNLDDSDDDDQTEELRIEHHDQPLQVTDVHGARQKLPKQQTASVKAGLVVRVPTRGEGRPVYINVCQSTIVPGEMSTKPSPSSPKSLVVTFPHVLGDFRQDRDRHGPCHVIEAMFHPGTLAQCGNDNKQNQKNLILSAVRLVSQRMPLLEEEWVLFNDPDIREADGTHYFAVNIFRKGLPREAEVSRDEEKREAPDGTAKGTALTPPSDYGKWNSVDKESHIEVAASHTEVTEVREVDGVDGEIAVCTTKPAPQRALQPDPQRDWVPRETMEAATSALPELSAEEIALVNAAEKVAEDALEPADLRRMATGQKEADTWKEQQAERLEELKRWKKAQAQEVEEGQTEQGGSSSGAAEAAEAKAAKEAKEAKERKELVAQELRRLDAQAKHLSFDEASRSGEVGQSEPIFPPTETKAGPVPLKPGDLVRICGLKAKPQYNGETGTVLGPQGDRLGVSVRNGLALVNLALKPENLRCALPNGLREAAAASRKAAANPCGDDSDVEIDFEYGPDEEDAGKEGWGTSSPSIVEPDRVSSVVHPGKRGMAIYGGLDEG
jgi:hypothetical protein